MADPIQGKCSGGMVHIPDGLFMMGSERVVEPHDKKSRHEVRVTDYFIDRHEVTHQVFSIFAALKYELILEECESEGILSIVARDNDPKVLAEALKKIQDDGKNCMAIRRVKKSGVSKDFNGLDQPAIVNWFEADAYCRSIGKRLPTEAEWEKAAVGPGKGYDPKIIYGTKSGDKLKPEEVVYNTDQTADVCSKLPNGYGLYDMAGNVWEWVNDWYGADYYEDSPDTNPQGPMDGDSKLLRGGSWLNHHEYYLYVTYRSYHRRPDYRDDVIGFRCASSQSFPK